MWRTVTICSLSRSIVLALGPQKGHPVRSVPSAMPKTLRRIFGSSYCGTVRQFNKVATTVARSQIPIAFTLHSWRPGSAVARDGSEVDGAEDSESEHLSRNLTDRENTTATSPAPQTDHRGQKIPPAQETSEHSLQNTQQRTMCDCPRLHRWPRCNAWLQQARTRSPQHVYPVAGTHGSC